MAVRRWVPGHWTKPRRRDGLCPRCGVAPRGESGYCVPCRREYLKTWRTGRVKRRGSASA